MKINNDEHLTQDDAATYLNKTRKTLCRWRNSGVGPSYYEIMGRITYKISDLNKWIESCRVELLQKTEVDSESNK